MTRGTFRPSRVTLTAVCVATCALYVLRVGYDWGASDQDEFLPLLLHYSNPDLFTSDPFVTMQLASWSVRSAFVWFMNGLSLGIVPIAAVVLVVYVVGWLATALAIARLASSFASGAWAGLVSIPAALLVTMRWAPGGNDVVYPMLVPEMVAWSLALWALAILSGSTRGTSTKLVMAGILCGLAAWVHVLVGLQVGGVILLWLMVRDRRHALSFLGPWLLIALPSVGLVMSGVGLDAESTYILTHLRAPHHYLPAHVPTGDWIRFSVLLTGAASLLYRYPEYFKFGHPEAGGVGVRGGSARRGSARRRLSELLVLSVLLLASGTTLVHFWPNGPWTAAQPFKLAVLVRILSVVAISCVAARLLEHGSRVLFRRAAPAPGRHVQLAAVFVLVLFVAVATLSDYWRDRAFPFQSDERVQMYTYAARVQQATPPDAVILVPPDWTGFQYASRRAQWVSFKAFPFERTGVLRWKEKLELVGVPSRDLAGVAWLKALSASYRSRTTEEWRRLFVQVDATHAVLPERHAPRPHVFCDREWCLVELSRILPP